MEKTERIYVGSGKEKFDGNLVEATICLTDIKDKGSEHIFEFSGKKYIKVKVQKKKDGVDKYGKSHYIEVDTFKPEKKTEEQPSIQQEEDDLPF